MNPYKQARTDAGLTQKAAAALVGVPHRTWQDWEYDLHKPPAYVEKLILEKLKEGKNVRI